MHLYSIITTGASLVLLVVANGCNQDNCYRALEHYQETSSASFCKQYLHTKTKTAPSGIATCGSSRISSACSCLTTTTPPPVTTTSSSSFDTSTCTPQSIAACPTAYDPCCAFICAEAQVPFDVCSPNNRTVLASCSQCKYPATAKTSSTPKTTTSAPKTTAKTTTKTTPKSTTKTTAKSTTATSTAPPKTTFTTTASTGFPFPTSTCTGRLLSTAGCPTPYDHCCQYVCEEAQVPSDVCSLTNGSGEFAVCTSCPSPSPT